MNGPVAGFRVVERQRMGIRSLLIWLALLGLVGCAAERIRGDAESDLAGGRYEEAVAKLRAGMERFPDDLPLRVLSERAQSEISERLIREANAARGVGALDAAESSLQRLLTLFPNNQRARKVFDQVQVTKRHRAMLASARELAQRGQVEGALAFLKPALKEDPKDAELVEYASQLEAQLQAEQDAGSGQLQETRAITLEFRDGNLRMILEALTKNSGVNFVVDKDVRSDLRATVFLRQTRFEDALDLICSTNQLSKKVLDGQTVLIYPNTPEKTKEYQDLVIRAFYLSSANVKQTAAMLKSLLKVREPFVDEKLNLVIIRETPETIRLAEKLIALQDIAEPEVMMEVEVLEMETTRLQNLGIQYPGSVTFTALGPAGSASSAIGSSNLTLSNIRGIDSGNIGVAPAPSVTLSLQAAVTDSKILANPKIRARNRQKAQILIGEKLPQITSTATSTGFVTQSVQYVDVGIKLEVEPDIYIDDQVAIALGLEVSEVTGTVTTSAGTTAYTIGTRNASTLLQLRDGETQILAGLIDREDQSSGSRIPGIGDVPGLNFIFGTQQDNGDHKEVVLAITPHIVRNIRRPDYTDIQFWSGSENNIRSRPLAITNGAGRVGAAQAGAVSGLATAPLVPGVAANSLSNPGSTAKLTIPVQLSWEAVPAVRVGDTFKIALRVQSEVALRGMPVNLEFNKGVLEIEDVEPGDFFQQGAEQVSSTKTLNQGDGKGGVGILRNSGTGAKGAGAVLLVKFRALAVGDADVKVASAKPIGLTGPVPEPASTTPAHIVVRQ